MQGRGEGEELDDRARAAAPGRFARLIDGATHYETAGPPAGPAVVLVHGFSTPLLIWERTAPALAAAGCCTVAYDLYGRGYSDRLQVRLRSRAVRAAAARPARGARRPLAGRSRGLLDGGADLRPVRGPAPGAGTTAGADRPGRVRPRPAMRPRPARAPPRHGRAAPAARGARVRWPTGQSHVRGPGGGAAGLPGPGARPGPVSGDRTGAALDPPIDAGEGAGALCATRGDAEAGADRLGHGGPDHPLQAARPGPRDDSRRPSSWPSRAPATRRCASGRTS